MAPALRNSVCHETSRSIVVSPAFSFKGLLLIVTVTLVQWSQRGAFHL